MLPPARRTRYSAGTAHGPPREAIPLAALLPAGLDPTAFKVHFAVWDGNKQAIDVLATNHEEWQGWNWNIRRRMESVLPAMTVSSILEEPFAGDPFPGHDRINHSLADLQAVVAQARVDWRIALESMKGVYVIHDKETGQRYVGSAYGDTGVWQRWATYAATLHGGNVGLKELAEQKGEEYYRTNMRFALLEYWSMRTDDAHVLERESYWKEVLQARSLGHNKNGPE
ncbi:GIY-YIG nuclease family protein [Nocardioides sp. zg-DK7169]|uniref:GIY-YIG nuclease family protein n=1 Tax=Nocardioides sp. zg-DK7169 TaxID=2736600 RepID=UPI0015560831|nr:GIY-YIG nuclease family protein [Nocardioides sp. zg-DK7169]NPC98823.1 GIY-YIG nuclease family protein [Nocardioides sp. zg-DK7169]